jgi:hypothetical protein
MGRPPLRIDVALKRQKELANLLNGGVQQVRVVLRALAAANGQGRERAADSNVIPLTPQAIRKIGHRYAQVPRPRLKASLSICARLLRYG